MDRRINASLEFETSHGIMKPTPLDVETLNAPADGFARLEQLSHAQAKPDAHIRKWSRRARMSFLLVSGFMSWAVLIALAVIILA